MTPSMQRRVAKLGGVAAVYASPLERTRETAAPIARAIGLRTRVRAGLLECDFGEWTGRRLSDLTRSPEWRAVQSSPSAFRFPGGESFAEMQHRIVDTVTTLAAHHRGERIVCVSHADPIKAFVTHLQGVHLDLFQRTVISPCSLSVVEIGHDRPLVLAVNSTGDDLSNLAPS
ncbi:MAG: histidine phosphatase family protein [Microthrixaceae bacterium]